MDQQDSSPQAPQEQTDPSQDPSLPDHLSSPSDEIQAAIDATSGGSEPKKELEAGDTKGVSSVGQQGKPKEENASPAPERLDRVKPQALSTFHRQQREFEAQRQAFNAEKAEAQRIKSVLENAKHDRIAALEAMGYTDVKSFLEGLAEDGGRITPERKQLMELKQWKEQQEAAEKDRQAQLERQQSEQATMAKLDEVRRQVQNKIKSETYSQRLVNLPDADEQVMLQMDKMASETGEMPDIGEAIEAVEGRFRSYLDEMAANPAVRSYFEEKLRSTKSQDLATPQSKQRAKTKTIDSGVPNPGLRQRASHDASADGEQEIQEALAYLKNFA